MHEMKDRYIICQHNLKLQNNLVFSVRHLFQDQLSVALVKRVFKF